MAIGANRPKDPELLEALYGRPLPRPSHSLEPLSTVQRLDRDEFIDLLNRRDDPEAFADYLWAGEILPQASVTLRGWVDEWLDSGRTADGADDPRERSLKKAEKASLAAYEYSKRGRISLLGTEDGLEIWFDTYNPKDAIFRPLIGPQPEDVAREKLVFFLLSDFRYRLAKCRRDECGRYFALNHWNRRYRRGTFCNKCQRSRSLESAVKATARDRVAAESSLYRMAAKRFARRIQKDPQWYQDPVLKARIADHLNDQIHKRDELKRVYHAHGREGVTAKWVSWSKNYTGIELAFNGGE